MDILAQLRHGLVAHCSLQGKNIARFLRSCKGRSCALEDAGGIDYSLAWE